jgi:hypothetical protein
VNRHFYVNFVGNGSSILVRKHVLEEIGGYSSTLLEANAQGCEDLLLQLRIALHYRFGTVPEYLVGYRLSPNNMSANQERMLRSSLIALTMVLAECPDFTALEKHGLIARNVWEYLKIIAFQGGRIDGTRFIWPYLKRRAPQVIKAAGLDATSKISALRKLLQNPQMRGMRRPGKRQLRHFYDYDPADMNRGDHLPLADPNNKLDNVYQKLADLSPLDASYRPEKYFNKNSMPSFK